METITLYKVLEATRHCLTGLVMTVEGIEERRADGIKTGNKFDYVSISVNNVWSASKPGSQCCSCEKIGYHRGSVDFILGVLSTGCTVYVYREVDGEVTKKLLVP